MPFYQIDFVRMQRYTTGVDAPSLEVAELKAEQIIPEIEESDWDREEIDFVAFEYKEPPEEFKQVVFEALAAEAEKAKKEADILKEYFGDRWEEFDIYAATVGYHITSKTYIENNALWGEKVIKYYDEDYFLLETNNRGCIKPCYADSLAWEYDSDEIAYVYQDSDKVLVSINEAKCYFYSDIQEELMGAGIEEPDMDRVAKLLRGQSIEELIEDYKKEVTDESF